VYVWHSSTASSSQAAAVNLTLQTAARMLRMIRGTFHGCSCHSCVTQQTSEATDAALRSSKTSTRTLHSEAKINTCHRPTRQRWPALRASLHHIHPSCYPTLLLLVVALGEYLLLQHKLSADAPQFNMLLMHMRATTMTCC
jgi:hypothetical protein